MTQTTQPITPRHNLDRESFAEMSNNALYEELAILRRFEDTQDAHPSRVRDNTIDDNNLPTILPCNLEVDVEERRLALWRAGRFDLLG